jgi:hypothetical protein
MRGGQTATEGRRQLGRAIAGFVAIVALLVVAAALGDPAGPGRRPQIALPGRALLLTFDMLVGALFTGAIIALVLLAWAGMTGPRGPLPRPHPWWRQPVRFAVLAVVVLVLVWQLDPGWLSDRMSQLV